MGTLKEYIFRRVPELQNIPFKLTSFNGDPLGETDNITESEVVFVIIPEVTKIHSRMFGTKATATLIWGKVTCEGPENLGGTAPEGLENVEKIVASDRGFAALTSDKRVVAWPWCSRACGGSGAGIVPEGLENVEEIVASDKAFAALTSDKHVVAWGSFGEEHHHVYDHHATAPEGLENVEKIVASDDAFAALTSDKRVVAWGNFAYGGRAPKVKGLENVEKIVATCAAFAALTSDKRVVAWGHAFFGGPGLYDAPEGLENVEEIVASDGAFAALTSDKRVVAWGSEHWGGTVPEGLENVEKIVATFQAFAAQTSDKRVVIWGHPMNDGEVSKLNSLLANEELNATKANGDMSP